MAGPPATAGHLARRGRMPPGVMLLRVDMSWRPPSPALRLLLMMILGHPVVDVVLGFPVLLLLLFVFTAVPETAVAAAVSAASGSGIVARAGSFIRIKPGDNIFKIWNILVCRSIIFETIVIINYLFLVLAKILYNDVHPKTYLLPSVFKY